MKSNKKAIGTQRRMMDKKIAPWLPLGPEKRPSIGWLKAVRGALGISSRQLAQIIGIDASAITRLEEREPAGKVTLELLDRAAGAMGCKIVYAIVPNEEYKSLEGIIETRARNAAEALLKRVEHSMKLEAQGSPDSTLELEKLTRELKEKMDPRIWGIMKKRKGRAEQ